jgi:predicted metal-dependent hydrolase
MIREQYYVQYGTRSIDFTVIRSDRKTLEIAVEPDATVVISAPLDASIDRILARVRRRAAWVQRQQRFFAQYVPRTPDRQFISGETHLYLGRQYRLKVVSNATETVKLIRGFIVVESKTPECLEITRDLVNRWYKSRAFVKFAERLELNLLRFPDSESFRPNTIMIRSLRQRWGSMSPSCGLLLNRRLIQAPIDAIDYVITHELCHIAEPQHNSKFFQLLSRILPDWQRRKERLEKMMA